MRCRTREAWGRAAGVEDEMSLATVTLDDKYTLESGRIFLTGIQALVRLPMVQRQQMRRPV